MTNLDSPFPAEPRGHSSSQAALGVGHHLPPVPPLPQSVPSPARRLEAGERWARLAQARAASRPGLCADPYMTTAKTRALIIQIFVGKVMSLLFNMLSRFVIAFLPRSKCLLILWLQSPSTVILRAWRLAGLSSALAFPLDLGARSLCRRLRGRGRYSKVHRSWRRKWQPTPVFLPGEFQGRGSLVGFRLWGRTESDKQMVTAAMKLKDAYSLEGKL